MNYLKLAAKLHSAVLIGKREFEKARQTSSIRRNYGETKNNTIDITIWYGREREREGGSTPTCIVD